MISLAESVSKCFHAFSRYQIDYLIAMLALFSLLRKRQTMLFCAMPCRAVFYEGYRNQRNPTISTIVIHLHLQPSQPKYPDEKGTRAPT